MAGTTASNNTHNISEMLIKHLTTLANQFRGNDRNLVPPGSYTIRRGAARPRSMKLAGTSPAYRARRRPHGGLAQPENWVYVPLGLNNPGIATVEAGPKIPHAFLVSHGAKSHAIPQVYNMPQLVGAETRLIRNVVGITELQTYHQLLFRDKHGQPHMCRYIVHPGFAGNTFIERAISQVRPEAVLITDDSVNQTIRLLQTRVATGYKMRAAPSASTLTTVPGG
jgi:hypothetical protein